MARRGVTRPETHSPEQRSHEQDSMEKSGEQRLQMERQHHQQTLWAPLTVVILGGWLLSGPFTFGYASGPIMWSDLISALLLLVLGGIWCKTPRHPTVPWAACSVGIWLQFAPLVFWAENPAAYLTDTFVGAWVIALTVLIPGMPSMILMMQRGPETPSGWSYNPSSWVQRAPLIATALMGWFISRYLAAYQLGYIDSAWDPFFGEGSERVLSSEVSKAWPISDAGLGAFAYTFEALMGFMGGIKRWRTMPWMVLFFGILVIPLGLVHIALVVMQPVLVGHWCTLCLAAAAIMLVMIPLAVDEVVAMGQFLRHSYRGGKPLWSTFWKGGGLEEERPDERSPAVNRPLRQTLPAMFWGMSFPWTLIASAAVGLWLMCAPALFQTVGRAADSSHLVGAVVLTVSVISMAEVLRAGRYLNVLLGFGIIALPLLISGLGPAAQWSHAAAGLLLVLLSIRRGPVKQKYGSWDRCIF